VQPPNQKLARLSAWLCGGLLTAALLLVQRVDYHTNAYALTEWLIFYPGHFIRRGLKGTVLFEIAQLCHVAPKVVALAVSTLAYTALIAISMVILWRWLWANARGWLPLLLLSPAGVFFYLNSSGAVNRFDVVFLLLTVGHLELLIRNPEPEKYLPRATLYCRVSEALCNRSRPGVLRRQPGPRPGQLVRGPHNH
jgi:hypothetical protein